MSPKLPKLSERRSPGRVTSLKDRGGGRPQIRAGRDLPPTAENRGDCAAAFAPPRSTCLLAHRSA